RYNLLDFEVYEFNVDFNNIPFSHPEMRLRIKCTDDFYDEENYYTDTIYVLEEQEKTLSIVYYGDDNRDIFYMYNIRHFIRLRYLSIKAYIKDEVESSIGDFSGQIEESSLYDGNIFTFDYLTRDAFLKVCIALSSPYLYINNIGYFKNENIEYENIEGTNLYQIRVVLLKNNMDIHGGKYPNTTLPTWGTPVYIPKLLSGQTGLIKI